MFRLAALFSVLAQPVLADFAPVRDRDSFLDLLADLCEAYKLTYLFISHDLGVVQHICDTVAVMYLGQIVEVADPETFFTAPKTQRCRDFLNKILHH